MMLWRYPRQVRLAVRLVAYLGALLFLLQSLRLLGFFVQQRRYDSWVWTPCPGSSLFEQSCTASRALIAQDIQIVVKTGGTEPQNRLRYQLATLLSKVPRRNILVFSDLEEEIDSYYVYNVFADVSEQERANYPEFALYDKQQLYKQQGRDTRELQGGWDLAK